MEIEIYHVDQAINGSKEALEAIIENIEGPVFNLSLRMLGRIEDAEDAKQDILIKVITSLSSYKGKSLFSTWVYKIAVNHLINEKNKDFVNHPLSFEIFGSDIDRYIASSVDQTNPAEKKIFSEELKLSCTNVLLQCLNPFDRLIFILGTMFDVDSRLGSEITRLSASVAKGETLIDTGVTLDQRGTDVIIIRHEYFPVRILRARRRQEMQLHEPGKLCPQPTPYRSCPALLIIIDTGENLHIEVCHGKH